MRRKAAEAAVAAVEPAAASSSGDAGPVPARSRASQTWAMLIKRVGHQAVSPNLHPVLPAPRTHQLQVQRVVLKAKKRLLPTISPLRNVMR